MTPPDEEYGRRDRLLLHHHTHQYLASPSTPSPGDRYIPPPAPAPSDRYPAPADRYLPPPTPTPSPGERYLPPAGDRYSGDRYLASPGGDRYLSPPAPAPGERYIPPPAPAPNDRYLQPPGGVSGDRYLPPSAPAPGERYLPPPAPAPGERYLPPPAVATTPGGPGDPYMRRDLGYHHHYRLPYHPHPAHHHQYHPHYGHHHHQRALPHRPLNYHPHHVVPSPSRGHIRCCPSPSHFAPSPGVPGASSPGGPPAPTTPTAPTPTSGSSPSPLMPHRGRTPPCGSGVSQRPVSGAIPVVEYVGASGGRHVSTPTPPPSLPRCSSLSSCDAGGADDAGKGQVTHLGRVGGGCMDKLDPGSTMSLCCGSSRRFGDATPAPSLPGLATLLHTPHHAAAAVWRAVSQQSTSQGSTGGGPPQSLAPTTPSPAETPPPQPATPTTVTLPAPSAPVTQPGPSSTSHQVAQSGGGVASDHLVQRSMSVPAPSHHPAPRLHLSSLGQGDHPQQQPRPPAPTTNRPTLGRSVSRSEVVKQYIKRETAVFFGVEESCEKEQQERWLNRRKRLATRKYGPLREGVAPPRTPTTPSPAPPLTPHITTSAYATQQSRESRPDVLPSAQGRDSTEAPSTPRWSEPPVRRKESVAKMTFGGLAFVVATLTRHRPRPAPRSRQWLRSYAPSTLPHTPSLLSVAADESASPTFGDDEVFFDKPIQPAALTMPLQQQPPGDSAGPSTEPAGGEGGFAVSRDQLDHPLQLRDQYTTRERPPSWRRTPERMETASESGPEVGCSRIWSRVLDRVFDNSDRRTYGMGVMGRFFGRSIKRRVAAREDIQEQLEDIEDHRPFFTYWVTTVQVLILIISLVCYGLGPIGIDLNPRSGQVLVTSLSLQQVDYKEPANFWIGPRAADLIHLGAKFAPCMRKDAKIIKEIEKGREKERETACCIRNDDSGCVQSSQADCSVRGLRPTTISTWKKWSAGDSGPGGRISGSVCGLDPKFCEAPASVAPYEWPDDITKWPICRKTNSNPQMRSRYKDKIADHMVCEVIGHPCCIGIHGMCRITTKEYCDFVRGYFHEEASLCSQVSCLDDVCGMIAFFSPETPDQFYRLWMSLFLHAGIFQLAITLVIQYFLMRDLEKLTGSLRIMIIYMGSGVAGNLASAIFVPYRADVGPSGAQFGLLACLIVEVLNAWMMLKQPEQALLKLIGITLVLFLFGMLPWVDNYAHLFGFIFGFLLSYALMPFVSFGDYDRQKKVCLVWVCLLSSLFLFTALVVLFYIIPVYDCEVCSYFNCVPLTTDFCASQNINFMREEPVV